MDYDSGEIEIEVEVRDVVLAYQAAMATALRLREDIAIMEDLAVIRLSECNEPPIEVIRYSPLASFAFSAQIH
jgi:hypothetical protein